MFFHGPRSGFLGPLGGFLRKTTSPRRRPPAAHPLHAEVLETRTLLSINPTLLADINSQTATESGTPTSLVPIGSTVYFVASARETGSELWRSDGTSAGTTLVKDILQGAPTGITGSLVEVNGLLYFAGNGSEHGLELWRSDGTSSGTTLVRDIRPGATGSEITGLVNVGGTLYFAANDGVNGIELWKSNGTSSGTSLVRNISPSSGLSSSPALLTNVGGTLFFTANDGSTGPELWKSDGTSSGTLLVREIRAGVSSPQFANQIAIDNRLFFSATDGSTGYELWTSDGTSTGTVQVRDISAGAGSSSPANGFNYNGILLFSANDGANGLELWRSDGTSDGTYIVRDIYAGATGSVPTSFVQFNGRAYFAANAVLTGRELWSTDGTSTGTTMVLDLNPGTVSASPTSLTVVGSNLNFAANTSATAIELFRSDGTSTGTVLVRDIAPGNAAGSGPTLLTNVAGTLFFSANDNVTGREFWKSDGTNSGTALVRDIRTGTTGSGAASLTPAGSKLFFAANNGTAGTELWVTDGTSSGTQMLEIYSGATGSSPAYLTDVNGTLFFSAANSSSARELWKSDGTSSGTVLVRDIFPGAGNSAPFNLFNANGTLFFWANSSNTGNELWKSDGTSSGTVLVADINPGANGSNIGGSFTLLNNEIYFGANDGVNGFEIWKSDGTSTGTVRLTDVNPSSGGGGLGSQTEAGGIVYFTRLTVSGFTSFTSHLFRLDSTLATGAVQLDNFPAGSAGANTTVSSLRNVGGTLFFQGGKSVDATTGGIELWKSDGTTSGTELVRDINPGTANASPADLFNWNGTIYFRACGGATGTELWKSDGTSSGTVLLADIDQTPGFGSGMPSNFAVLNNTLYFSAANFTSGSYELWQSNGTSSGTSLVADIWPGFNSSFPKNLLSFQGGLYFVADDGVHGAEVFGTGLDFPPSIDPIADRTVNEADSLAFTATAAATGGPLFSLLPGAPAGASIHPTTGLFTWTPQDNVGSPVSITVRVTDDQNRTADASFTVTVNNVAPTLSFAGLTSGNAAIALPFTLTATDPSPADQAGTFTYYVDWENTGVGLNDGEMFTGGATINLSHMFPVPGDHTIRYIAYDKDGGHSGVHTTTLNTYVDPRGLFSIFQGEKQVNTYTAGAQEAPAIATDIFGHYVVVWSSFGQDGGAEGIYFQRYASGGYKIGNEKRVNEFTATTQSQPAVAMDSNGNFVVTWLSISQVNNIDYYGLFARRYNAYGIPLGNEFRVTNLTLDTIDTHASIAMNRENGDFLVVWNGTLYNEDVIYGRWFNRQGVPLSGEFQVSTSSYSHSNPTAEIDSSGRAIVAWETHSGAPIDRIAAQRYAADRTPAGGEFVVSYASDRNVHDPDVAVDPQGNFVISWGALYDNNTAYDIRANAYAADGSLRWQEYILNSGGARDQKSPSISLDHFGTLTAVWQYQVTENLVVSRDVYGRRFDFDGNPLGNEFLVNSFTAGWQDAPVVAASPFGDLAVAWQSDAQDGSSTGIYTQQYKFYRPGNVAPVPNAGGPYAILEGQSLALNGSATDANGDPLWFSWDLNGDGNETDAYQAQPTVPWSQLVFAGAGDGRATPYNVTLRAGDGAKSDRSAPTTLTITNVPPVASLSGDTTAVQGLPFTLILQATDPSPVDQSFGFLWDIDWDGDNVTDQTVSATSGSAVTHVYSALGSPTIHVTATDKDGGVSNSASYPITVGPSTFVPLGGETQVNTTSAGRQRGPNVATNADGDYVVAWVSPDGDGDGIYAQRFSAAGVPLSGELLVNTTTAGAQTNPSVALDASGRFVVVWQSFISGSDYEIRAQRFDSANAMLGGEIAVNSYTSGAQSLPSVAFAGVTFVVTWQSAGQDGSGLGVYARQFSFSTGAALTAEFRVNTNTTADQYEPRVVSDDVGNFVITFSGGGSQDGSGTGVYFRRYNSSATALGSVVQANVDTAGNQQNPAIGMGSDNSFVVAWTNSLGDADGNAIRARRFDSSASPVGGEWTVNSTTAGSQISPRVAVHLSGPFVIAWRSDTQDGSGKGIYLKAYDADGSPLSGELRANTTTSGDQTNHALAFGGPAEAPVAIVAWDSPQDGDQEGVYHQRFAYTPPPSLMLAGASGAGSRDAALAKPAPNELRTAGTNGADYAAAVDAALQEDLAWLALRAADELAPSRDRKK